MSRRGHGQVRRSQVITTWGPGALLDLPRHSGIVGGLDGWPKTTDLDEVVDARLTNKLELMTGVTAPKLYAPPAASTNPADPVQGIDVWRFPEWMVVQEKAEGDANERSRRLVHRKALDEKGRFEGRSVVPTRFVAACARGHVDDIDWRRFVHEPDDKCTRQLWLDERGTGGDLVDLVVRCECGSARRPLVDAAEIEQKALGTCRGARPWLGRYAGEDCNLPARLLVRTASNAYFPQVLSALSLPEHKSALETAVAELSEFLAGVTKVEDLAVIRNIPAVKSKLAAYDDDEVFEEIEKAASGAGPEPPVKQVELGALLAAPEGFGDDVPVDPDFHARRLPDRYWRKSTLCDPVVAIIQLHRLREVLALTGFTRFEAAVPDTNGEYESDVERASLAVEPEWFPAVENRGEGLFLQLDSAAVKQWLDRPGVAQRVDELADGHRVWAEDRKATRPFPGGPYILLHSLAHLLIQSVAMRCGYPASSVRERIYTDTDSHRYGLLLYTASPDAEGTLGGLVQQARHIESHLAAALRAGGLCSNDPVCAQHSPGTGMEGRWLHGAACHGCALVAETSCEMRNDYLDRALVVPTLAVPDAAFFSAL